jgi:FMN reductase
MTRHGERNTGRTPLIVGFGGTTRQGSSGEQLVAAVLASCQAHGARTHLFGGAALAALPHFAPEVATRTPAQQEFIDAIRAADGVVIGSPGYHGGVSGLVKNAIDLLEDTRLDRRAYFDGLPVGLVVSAAGWQAGGITLAALRGIVHAMRGWPTPVGIAVNSAAQRLFEDDGRIADAGLAQSVREQARQIMRLAAMPHDAKAA